MRTSRRTFMRQVGVTLAGLLVSGCDVGSMLIGKGSPTRVVEVRTVEVISCYIPVTGEAAPPTHKATPDADAARWRALRACWLELADPGLAAADGTAYAEALGGRHREALDALVAARALDAEVAGHIGVAFEEAVAHIQRKQATCYEPLAPGAANPYPPREEVVSQAAALAEMAGRSGIGAETVAVAQATLARDMAWLDQFRAGGSPGEVTSMEAAPAEVEAARVLVELLVKAE